VPTRDPTQNALIAQIAARTRWANEDSKDPNGPLPRARAASPGSREYWLRQVDPDGTLDERERARRAANAHRAHMARLTLKSVQVRRARAAARKAAGR